MKLRSTSLIQPYIEEELRLAWETGRKNFGLEINFYVPSLIKYETSEVSNLDKLLFVPISITGQKCKLNCKHCGGQMLRGSYSAETPAELERLAGVLQLRGVEGLLITGGSERDGRVDFNNYFKVIKKIKTKYRFRIAVHTGLVTKDTAEKLADSGIDVAMLDIIGADTTIKDIYNLDKTIKDFETSVELLCKTKMKVVPHIVIGLERGKIKGEIDALKMLLNYPISSLVLVIFKPLKGTELEGSSSPDIEEIKEILIQARLLFPKIPVVLGCAKPWGLDGVNIDCLAIKAGLNGIAFPREGIVGFAWKIGLNPRIYHSCCSLISISGINGK
jgi:hypothetical protein